MNVDHKTALRTERLSPDAAREGVLQEVTSWKGVNVGEHRFGGIEFRVGRRELGHLHASFADLPFPMDRRNELVSAGRARPHHIYPDSGWVTVPMRTKEEVDNVIAMLRENYVRATGDR